MRLRGEGVRFQAGPAFPWLEGRKSTASSGEGIEMEQRNARSGGARALAAIVAACGFVALGIAVAQAGQPCGINLTSLSKSSGYPGDTFEMTGTWGATQGTKIPCINMGNMNKLIVVMGGWSATKLTVKIPPGLPPGLYKVGVYCEPLEGGGTVYSSGWLDFKILPQPPDMTSKKGITIGGAVGGAGGNFVPWGGSVVLTETEALHGSPNSECAFNLSYDMENLQAVATGPAKFLNRIKADSKIVSIQSMLSMAASEVRQINTQAYLPVGGPRTLSLWIDDDHNVDEGPAGEGNNVHRIQYTLQGKCYKAYNPKK